MVRFIPSLSATSTSKATDGGAHWTKLTVKSGKVTLKNRKAGKGVSFKALVGDKKGNTLSQAINNAYLAK